MKKIIAVSTLALVLSLSAVVSYAQSQTYKYKCVRCGLIQEFDHAGVYKCPKDGGMMVSVNQTQQSKTYKYRCTSCGLIQEYDHAGVYKCPKDSGMMVSVR
jgi:DNA-directed RNA polymerase subunit RPC12/RpoP